MTKNWPHPCEEIFQAVWRPTGFDPSCLSEKTRRHLSTCPKCRDLLNDLITTRNLLTGVAPSNEPSEAETRHAVEKALRTASLLSDKSGVSENTGNPESPAKTAGMTLKEILGFALMSAVFLGFQLLALIYLKPRGFLTLHTILYWLAPFTLYAIIRVDDHRYQGGNSA